MNYTVTLNPSLDYSMHIPRLTVGALNRSEGESIRVGGKGINVAVVLTRLGIPCTALGFVGGFTGAELERQTRLLGVGCDFVHIEGQSSRINVKVCGESESELNGRGIAVSAVGERSLLEKLSRLREGDTLVLSGAGVRSESGQLFENILDTAAARGVRLVADCEGALLVEAIRRRPFLIKPNRAELCELLSKTEMSDREVAEAAAVLRDAGAQNVLVSLGADGAMLAAEDGNIYRRAALQGEVRSTVGAGDSAVAGFIAGYPKGLQHALACAVACGSATAFSEQLAESEELLHCIKTIGLSEM